ncbi:Phage baseplate J-like protein (plasmid) [Candidatus Trichorickettsia mobilis]|uniref:Phage baseplate J-like protein n=1 Tax=Candidatus Trichorickettsia mobilis TaxID=1346319 RepID=A0ABZ0UUH7_9RICK|nr:baseplate J/gp47 family protein [Candidatus Trichorickettsia mobilis]WPY01461.1 Phage baseplate J-like protein [Candidatus Trichorickettsia mobilis]
MADYGLSDSGLKIPTFDEIKVELESKLSSKLGGIDFELPSVYGTFSNVMSEELAILWEELQKLYNAFFVDTATGVSLDYVVAGNLLARLKPTYTKAVCQLTGVNSTYVPAGSQVMVKNSDITFSLIDGVTLSNTDCYAITLLIKEVKIGQYKITLDNADVAYTATAEDSDFTILIKLKELINSGEYITTADIINSSLNLIVKDVLKTFSCVVSDNIAIEEVSNNANFICDKVGKISAPAYSLTEIQTPVQGWSSVINVSSAVSGRELETDVELRDRQRKSLSIAGSSTDPAIEARLLQVTGVTAAKVTSDRDTHTINALVLGGEDNDVAKTLHSVRPAGIKLLGNTEIIVTDNSGIQYPIAFTRPTKIWISVQVDITKNSNFKEGSASVIKEKILTYINSIGVANAVTYQALFGIIYSVEGVVDAVVKIGGSLDESVVPTLKSENVAISDGQMPITNETKVVINVA